MNEGPDARHCRISAAPNTERPQNKRGCAASSQSQAYTDMRPREVRSMQQTVFTIGHSTHAIEYFVELLKRHAATALCDVRSKPYSRINPQFNRELLKQVLRESGIAYVFLGRELGARSADMTCYEGGRVKFDRLAHTELFQDGLDRVQEGMKNYRVVLMCAEKEPLECHRTILVARYLTSRGIDIHHIHADGQLESHASALSRLLRQLGMPEMDLFRSRDEMLAAAYRKQEERVAYSPGTSSSATGNSALRSAG